MEAGVSGAAIVLLRWTGKSVQNLHLRKKTDFLTNYKALRILESHKCHQMDLFVEHIRREYCFLLYWRLLLTSEDSSKQVLQQFPLKILVTFLQFSAAIFVLHREIYLLIFKKCSRGLSLIIY